MRFMNDFQGNYTCVASNAFRMKKQTFYLSETLAAPETTTGETPSTVARRPNVRRRGQHHQQRPLKNILSNNKVPGSAGNSTRDDEASKTNVRQAIEERNKLAAVAAAGVNNATRPPSQPAAVAKQRGGAEPGNRSPATAIDSRPQQLLPRIPPEILVAPPGDDDEESAGNGSGNGGAADEGADDDYGR
jgi:hypothetical protein